MSDRRRYGDIAFVGPHCPLVLVSIDRFLRWYTKYPDSAMTRIPRAEPTAMPPIALDDRERV